MNEENDIMSYICIDSLKAYLIKLHLSIHLIFSFDQSTFNLFINFCLSSGVVLGKGGGVVEDIRLPFSLGLGGPIGSGNQWFPWVHVEDIAGIVQHAIETDTVTGVLNGTAPGPVKSSEFTKAFASALCRPHIFPLPEFAVKTVFGSEEANMLLDGQKVLPKRTQDSGYVFKYPDIQSACKQVVS